MIARQVSVTSSCHKRYLGEKVFTQEYSDCLGFRPSIESYLYIAIDIDDMVNGKNVSIHYQIYYGI
jgi:hypothetical protein